jgi:hypothetical protein
MEIDRACLRWAKVENLERLARALRVPLPIHRRTHGADAYHRALVRVVANAIANERCQAIALTPGVRS